MELYDVMRTTFSAREFTADPLPDEILFKILDRARFAPSGGNRQGWKIIVVRDQKTKERAHEFRETIVDRAFEKGLLLLGAGENTIRVAPPLMIDEEQADFAARTLEECIREVETSA